MENYQRKRLQPLAFLVIGLALTPLVIAPAAQMIAPALSASQGAPAMSLMPVRQQPDPTTPATATTSDTATAVPVTLEGMTLDAPIHIHHLDLLTKSLA
jgi:hypothetical protein